MDDLNPYAAPKANMLVADADASRVRYEHLRTESHLKALGWVILVFGISLIVSAWMMKQLQWHDFGLQPGLEVIPWYDFAIAGARVLTGLGLLRLKKWACDLAIILSAIEIFLNVLHLPYSLVGITVHMFILRFLFQKPTRFVFSEPYQAILRQTPLIKSPVATWGLLVIMLLLFTLLIPALTTLY